MNKELKESFNKIMYEMTKQASKYSFVEFLEELEVSEDHWEQIAKHLLDEYEIKTYV